MEQALLGRLNRRGQTVGINAYTLSRPFSREWPVDPTVLLSSVCNGAA